MSGRAEPLAGKYEKNKITFDKEIYAKTNYLIIVAYGYEVSIPNYIRNGRHEREYRGRLFYWPIHHRSAP